MNSQLEKEIQKVLKNRRHEAESLASYNLSRARENEEFVVLEKETNALKMEIAKKEIENENVEKLLEKLEKNQKNMQKMLKKLNISSIEPNYFCKQCNDTGVSNGKYCKCKNAILSEILLKKSGFNKISNFTEVQIDEINGLLYSKIKEWCDKYPNVSRFNIFLTGKVGVGKTTLCECIANELIQKHQFVLYTTAFLMNKNFLEYCKTGNEEMLNSYLNADVLIIDDLGTEPLLNNVTENYFYLIINERLIKNKSTIINSNLMPDEILDRYGERIFSRIMNKRSSLVIELLGDDKRIK